jgi:FAD/FMN-containing dehydrogenase
MALARIPAHDPRGRLDIPALEAGLTGTVICPSDEEYEDARLVHNAAIDRRPAMIVRPANAADVARTVVFARDAGLELAVRGGGHSLAGHGTTDGGIVLDLGAMKGLHIDADRRLAWAQPGLTAGEYTKAAAAHGLATPFGDAASVGIAGLTLGGGIGWLVRKHGLTIDALVSVDVVTADGRLVTASATEHEDLFWAVRGGGGNFGVVTRFQFRLYPVETILGGAIFLPPTREVLRSLVPLAASAPDEPSIISFLMPAPPAPFVPVEAQGTMTLALMFVYAGDIDDGQRAIAPFREVAAPVAEVVAPMPYPAIYEFTAGAEERSAATHRSLFLDALDDEAVDTILERMTAPSSPTAIVQIRVLGGAMAAVPTTATAFAHRDAAVMVTLITPIEEMATAPLREAWTQAFYEALTPGSIGVYANFLEDEGEARIREAYPGETYRRLAEVKRRYDPTNVFHRNQNIRPAAEA